MGRRRSTSTTAPSATRATARRSTACGSPSLGLIEGFEPDLIVSGINHGSNLGDDITYSGTVAAALEGVVLGVPGIAVSQQSVAREMDFRLGERFDFETAAAFAARLVEQLDDVPLPEGTLLNVNVPGGRGRRRRGHATGQAHLPRRADLVEEEDGRRRYRIYGDSPVHDDEAGTDLAAVSAGPHRGHAAALRPHGRARAWRRCATTTSRGCSRPAARGGAE